MRKIVVGTSCFIAGVLMTLSISAYGADLSKVGKTVLGEYSVVIDGEALPQKAVGIDGSTYAPLRAIGESLGYEVDFVNKQVQFTKKGSVPTNPDDLSQIPTSNSVNDQITELEKEKNDAVNKYLDSLGKYDGTNLTVEQKAEVQSYLDRINEIQKQIDDLKTQQ